MKEPSIVLLDHEILALHERGEVEIRRVMKPQPWMHPHKHVLYIDEDPLSDVLEDRVGVCKYLPGDRFWIKEPWQAWTEFDERGVANVPSTSGVNYLAHGNVWHAKRRTAASMPGWASRFDVETTGVRVEKDNGQFVWVVGLKLVAQTGDN